MAEWDKGCHGIHFRLLLNLSLIVLTRYFSGLGLDLGITRGVNANSAALSPCVCPQQDGTDWEHPQRGREQCQLAHTLSFCTLTVDLFSHLPLRCQFRCTCAPAPAAPPLPASCDPLLCPGRTDSRRKGRSR